MKTGTMKIYFNSDLDGSNQTVAVADSGLSMGISEMNWLVIITSSMTVQLQTDGLATELTFLAPY